MNVQGVYGLFADTLSAEQQRREHAERILQQSERSPDFAWSLMQLLVHPPGALSSHEAAGVQHAGAIYFKNLIVRYWSDERAANHAEQSPSKHSDDEDDGDYVEGNEAAHRSKGALAASSVENLPAYCIGEDEKGKIKEHLVPALLAMTDKMRTLLLPALAVIVRHDFPQKYPQLLPHLHFALQQCQQPNGSNLKTLAATLALLYTVVKRYELVRANQRKPMGDIVASFFPVLCEISHQYLLPLSSPSLSQSIDISADALIALKVICKIYFSAIQLEFPKVLMEASLERWMSLFVALLQQSINVHDETRYFAMASYSRHPQVIKNESGNIADSANNIGNLSEDERAQYPGWQVKKWVSHLVLRLLQRYCHPAISDKKYRNLSKYLMSHQMPVILTAYLSLLSQHLLQRSAIAEHTEAVKGLDERYISPKVLYYMLYFFSDLAEHAETWQWLKPSMMNIITDVIFPLLKHSASDAALWRDEPVTFVQRKFDMMQDFRSTVSAAKNCLSEVLDHRKKSMLMPVLQFVQTKLATQNDASLHSNGINNEAGGLHDGVKYAMALDRDGSLAILGCLKTALEEHKALRNGIPDMIQRYVVPELQSPYPFLRARACWMIEVYSDMLSDFVPHAVPRRRNVSNAASSESLILTLTQGSVLLLTRDGELPVRIYASLALGALLNDHAMILKQHVQYMLPDVLQVLLQLTNETDLEDLASVIRDILSEFAEQLAPYAVQICTSLRDMYLKIEAEELQRKEDDDRNGEDEDDEEDMSHKALTSYGLLRGILTLLYALEGAKDILLAMEPVLIPLFTAMLDHEMIENYDELFQMISIYCCYLKESLPVNVIVQVIPRLHRSVVVQKDAADMFIDMLQALEYMVMYCRSLMSKAIQDMINEMILTVLKEKETCGEENAVAACQLVETACLYHNDWLDAPMVESLCGVHRKSVIKALKLQSALALLAGLYADPVRICAIMEDVAGRVSKLSTYRPASFLMHSCLEQQEKLFKRVHDKKLLIFVMLKLYAVARGGLPSSSLPLSKGVEEILLPSVPLLLSVYQSLPKAYERREQQRIEYENDEDDEDGENEDDSEGDEDVLSDREDAYEQSGSDEELADGADSSAQVTEWSPHGGDADDEEDDTEDGWNDVDEDFERDTVIEQMDEYDQFKQLMTVHLPQVNVDFYQAVVRMAENQSTVQHQMKWVLSEANEKNKRK